MRDVPERPIEPPPGWMDAEYPTLDDEDEHYYEEADYWDEDE